MEASLRRMQPESLGALICLLPPPPFLSSPSSPSSSPSLPPSSPFARVYCHCIPGFVWFQTIRPISFLYTTEEYAYWVRRKQWTEEAKVFGKIFSSINKGQWCDLPISIGKMGSWTSCTHPAPESRKPNHYSAILVNGVWRDPSPSLQYEDEGIQELILSGV